MVRDGPRWSTMARDGPRWSTMVRDGPRWSAMAHDGLRWSAMPRDGPRWSAMPRDGPRWSTMVRDGPRWSVMAHDGPRWPTMIAVLAFALVILALGLGLGLGLKKETGPADPHWSCRNRCYEASEEAAAGCRCHHGCEASKSCCHDFYDLCKAPTELWECTRLRCGEQRLSGSRCSCSDDCLTAGDCCTNYKRVCHDEPAWVEDECEELTAPACPAGVTRQPLLLVSLDGLRPDYLQKWDALLPVLRKLRTCGASAPFMQAAFPSKTFPNHYTIVTGLYPESNGLIDNVMYDPELNATFSLSSEEKSNPAWYLGQPIWHTARYQGLKSGTFFWPGSDVKINGSFPDIHRQYDGKVPFEERVFTVLQWLQLPEEQRPDFFTLYLEEPDKSGHSHGPDSGGLVRAIQDVDRIMGQLMDGLKQISFHRCLNLIVLADHGMEETSCSRKETLQELVGDVSRYWVTEGPFGRIRARDKDAAWDPAGLVANMTCRKPEQKIKAYLKAHLPKRLHFANSRRIEDVGVLVDLGWLFERSPGSLTFCSRGNHGYDNDAASMHAMFLSYGPKFLNRTLVEPFSNVELYNLMCDLLQISPADNNGTHGSLNHLLRQPFFRPSFPAEASPPGSCRLAGLVPEDLLGCSCPAPGVNVSNIRLNLSSEEALAAERVHAPFGRPRVLQPHHSYCLLHQEGFVSAYSRSLLMPLWTSFTVPRPEQPDPLPPVLPDCLRPDVRVAPSQSPRCDQHAAGAGGGAGGGGGVALQHAFLYPPSLNVTAEQRDDALLLSNVVPMYPEFQKIWTFIQNTLLRRYAFLYQGLNVVAGPVFDYNYDGQFDAPEQRSRTNISVPSHYFLLLTSCRDSPMSADGCRGELQTVSFLLPHRPDNRESCKSAEAESAWVEDLMWFHQSRVRDVEWAAGLDFYQGSGRPIAELLRVKTRPTAAIHRPQ